MQNTRYFFDGSLSVVDKLFGIGSAFYVELLSGFEEISAGMGGTSSCFAGLSPVHPCDGCLSLSDSFFFCLAII